MGATSVTGLELYCRNVRAIALRELRPIYRPQSTPNFKLYSTLDDLVCRSIAGFAAATSLKINYIACQSKNKTMQFTKGINSSRMKSITVFLHQNFESMLL